MLFQHCISSLPATAHRHNVRHTQFNPSLHNYKFVHLSLAAERLKEKLGIAVEPFTLRKKNMYTPSCAGDFSCILGCFVGGSRCQEQRGSECRRLTLTLALRAVWVSTGGIDKSRPPNVFKPSRYRGRLACLSKAFVGVDIKEMCKWSLTNRSDSNSETPERRRNDPAKASGKEPHATVRSRLWHHISAWTDFAVATSALQEA